MAGQIIVDARLMSGNVRGMGRYARQMINSILKHCIFAMPTNGNTGVWSNSIKKGRSFFPLWEQKTLPEIAECSDAHWVLCPYNTAPIRLMRNKRLILVVYDLIFMEPWRKLPCQAGPSLVSSPFLHQQRRFAVSYS